MDYDKTNMPETYRRARELEPAVLSQWMDVVSQHVAGESIHRILDLGCGTGRFSGALAERFNARVVGVDPSSKMLKEALQQRNPRVALTAANAEAIPLRSGSIDLIFVSMVFHHFSDRVLASSECARVLRPGGWLLLRTGTRNRISSYPYVPFFPTSRRLLEERLPSLAEQCRTFEEASFKTQYCGLLTQQIAPDHSAYADKLALRADSILLSLDDKEFTHGVDAIRREGSRGPIVEPIDFAFFRK